MGKSWLSLVGKNGNTRVKVAYLEDLENAAAQGCQSPGCDHKHAGPLFLHARCHDYEGLSVSFEYGNEYLVVACSKCAVEVIRIQIESKGRGEC